MSTLTEDTISIQKNENEEEDNENDNDNDNNDDKREEEDNNEGETSDQRPKTSDVWNFVDKETRKCPSCSKIFGKKTGTSSIRTHLKVMEYYLLKKNKQL